MSQSRLPASIRNKNPGAQYPGKSAKKFGSTSHEVLMSKDGRHLIATFPTHVQGAAAMFDLLASKGYTGRKIQDAITKWCGGFYVSTYIKVLESQGGVSRNTILTRELLENNPDAAVALCKAMAVQEAGREYPMTDAEWRQAHAMAFPDAEPAEEKAPDTFSPDNDLPSPKPTTRVIETAKRSRTIQAVLLSALGALVSAFNEVIAVALDASAKVSEWSSITGTYGMIKGLGLALVIGGTVWAIQRRLSDAANGRS